MFQISDISFMFRLISVITLELLMEVAEIIGWKHLTNVWGNVSAYQETIVKLSEYN